MYFNCCNITLQFILLNLYLRQKIKHGISHPNFYGNVLKKAGKFKQNPLGIVIYLNKLINDDYLYHYLKICLLWYQNTCRLSAQQFTPKLISVFIFCNFVLHAVDTLKILALAHHLIFLVINYVFTFNPTGLVLIDVLA